MSGSVTRVLGVDTSLRSSGVAIVEGRGSVMQAVHYGRIHNTARLPHSDCLRRIQAGIMEQINEHRPTAAALEGAFYCKNPKTAMILGEARGVVIAACATAGLPVYEFAPRRVKQAIAGNGGASKEQVRRMVMSILGLSEEPQEDAGDALAIAICYLNSQSGHAALAPQEI